jgi:hypothetical protein
VDDGLKEEEDEEEKERKLKDSMKENNVLLFALLNCISLLQLC